MNIFKYRTSPQDEWMTFPVIKGDPGYTPIKGIDYFTEEDINEALAEYQTEAQVKALIAAAFSEIATAEGGSY